MPIESPQHHAEQLLRLMLGSQAAFRARQWEAIEAVAVKRQRALVVQRTGWGKSLVYFLASKLLRDGGAGPTLLISPLLSLMRNQIEMAGRIGIRAYTIHSANKEEWTAVEDALAQDACDVMLISPERLNNDHFVQNVLPGLAGRIGLFVVDEAHCISDWGHDFRPDYRRIVRILQMLPRSVPVLGTTATANNRVVADVQNQLGPGLTVLRGALTRDSLRLQNIRLHSQSQRMAWLVQTLAGPYKDFRDGSGIIYCLTIADAERVAGFLKLKDFSVEAYHAGLDSKERERLEQAFTANEVHTLVATVALGMGFDKPDIAYVIHFQRPGSAVAYYQQVGRAGRAVDRSYGILLSGSEDDEIVNYFIDSAFPPPQVFMEVLAALEKEESLTLRQLQAQVNASYGMIEKALKLLEVDGAVGQTFDKGVHFFRTPNPWQTDTARYEQVAALRRAELSQMQAYTRHTGCLMEFLQRALDDPHPTPCGRCANCRGRGLPSEVSPGLVLEAETYLKGSQVLITPRKQWPTGLFPDQKITIPKECQNQPGRSLCIYGDSGWGRLVKQGKYDDNHFAAELVQASAHLVRVLWQPDPFPAWVTCIPSQTRPSLVPDFAARLAEALELPFYPALQRTQPVPEQKTMHNAFMQARNVLGSLAVRGTIPPGPALLVDDIIHSGWTLTMGGYLLQQGGCNIVYPFTLARAAGRSDDAA